MAGGPIYPNSAIPLGTTGHVYPLVYQGAGTTNDNELMLGVTDATTLSADAIWHLTFDMPPTLPSGTGKLKIKSRANASTGNLLVNPKWASVADGEGPDDATLSAEGSTTITFAVVDGYLYTRITLDADTLVADEEVHMDLTFEDTSTTVAVESGHKVSIIWE